MNQHLAVCAIILALPSSYWPLGTPLQEILPPQEIWMVVDYDYLLDTYRIIRPDGLSAILPHEQHGYFYPFDDPHKRLTRWRDLQETRRWLDSRQVRGSVIRVP
jgi:hypothetical protein